MKARKKKKLLKEAWLNMARKLPAVLLTEEAQEAWAVENCNKRIDEIRQRKRHKKERYYDWK